MSSEGEIIIKQEVMGGDWAQLLEELLIDIFKRTKCVEDMTSLSWVCSSWRAIITRMVKPKWSPAVPLFTLPSISFESPLLKWTLYGAPSITLENPSRKWTLYDPSTRKRCEMDLPPKLGWFPGCVDGWVYIMEESGALHFFNPFTKDSISLPNINKMPRDLVGWGFYKCREAEVGSRGCAIRSMIKVNIPPKNELYVIAILDLCWIVFAKHEDPIWSYVECVHEHQGERIFLENMIYYNGQIVILYGDGKMVGFDLDRLITDKKLVVVEEYVAGDVDGNTSVYGVEDLTKMYLVESCGDILLALLYDLSLMRFEMMKYVPKEKAWVGVKDIGDVSLFVGAHSVIAVCASNAEYCQPNYVYYTGDVYCRPSIRVFSLHNKEVGEAFHPCTTNLRLVGPFGPFWFMPNFKKC